MTTVEFEVRGRTVAELMQKTTETLKALLADDPRLSVSGMTMHITPATKIGSMDGTVAITEWSGDVQAQLVGG